MSDHSMRQSASRAIVFGGSGFAVLVVAQVALARFWTGIVNEDVAVMFAVAASFAACLIVGALGAFTLSRRRLVTAPEAAVLGAVAAVPAASSAFLSAHQIGFGGSLVLVVLVGGAIAAVGEKLLHGRPAPG